LADLGQCLRFGEQRDDSSWSRPAFATTTTTTTSSVTRSSCVAGEISAREFTAELVEVVDRQAQTHSPATLMQVSSTNHNHRSHAGRVGPRRSAAE